MALFRTKLLASHVALVATVGAIGVVTLNETLTGDLARQLDQRLEEQAKGAVEWSAEGGRRHPEKVAARISHIVDAEVTLFDRDGTVLGASSPRAREDLGPEVADAHRAGIGRATRMRDGRELHYVAVPGADGIVVRLAVPLSEVEETVAAMRRRLLLASAVAIALAVGLGILASRIASRPLAEMTTTATRLARGDFDVPIEEGATDEFGVLWRALKSLAQQLKARIGDLVAERDRLSAILAGMVEGVLVLDQDARVIVANPAVAKILRADGPDGSLVGKPLAEAVADDETRALIEGCLAGSEERETEIEIVDKRGASLAVYARRLPEGSGGAVVAVLRDMTALRKLMTIRRDFVANVSHELRTPVTAIQGYAETLLRGPGAKGSADEETRRQFLEIIHRQSQRIGTLVEQLLALSELEARGRDEIVRERVPIVPIARHVAEAVRNRAESRGVSVEIDAPEALAAIADPEGVERALLNLVDNAIKYGKESGRVRIEAARTGAATVTIAVSDDGPGIDPAHVPRLFERFYRVDPGRSRRQGGSGLGLSIVKHLVESMDGTIAVESEPGPGARFVVTLPAAGPDAGA
jgi:two-component system phosphate regulon sensor histidine kinase PhoR